MPDTTLTAQAESIAAQFLPEPTAPLSKRSNGRRLTRAEEQVILDLHALGKPQTEIAKTIDCAQSTISEFLNLCVDRRQLAAARLRNAAPDLVERLIRDAEPEHVLEVLDRLDVANKKQSDSGSGSRVNIVIGMPGQAAGPDPIVLLSPVEHQQLAE